MVLIVNTINKEKLGLWVYFHCKDSKKNPVLNLEQNNIEVNDEAIQTKN